MMEKANLEDVAWYKIPDDWSPEFGKFHIQLQVADSEEKVCLLRAAHSPDEEEQDGHAKLCLLNLPNK